MAEVSTGYVTLDVIQYESLVRENERLKAENDRLNSMLYHSDYLLNKVETMYQDLLNKLPPL